MLFGPKPVHGSFFFGPRGPLHYLLSILFIQSLCLVNFVLISNLPGRNHLGKSLFDPFRVALKQREQGKRRLVGRAAALFPVLQRAKLEAEKGGEFPLRQAVARAQGGDVGDTSRLCAPQPKRDPERRESARESADIDLGIKRANRPSRFGEAIERLVGRAERNARRAELPQSVDRVIELSLMGQDDNPSFGKRGAGGFVRDRRQTCESRLQF